MHVQMNVSKKTTNNLADPEVGFYVCVRLFLKEKEIINSRDQTRAVRRESPVT